MYENKDILIKVLESILDIKIDDIKYLNPNLNRRKFIEKGCNLDLYIKSKDLTGKILSKKLLYSEIYVDSLDKKEYNKYRYIRMLNKYSKDINGDEVEMKYKRALKNLEDDNLFEPMFTKEEDELRLRNSYKIHYKELGLKEGVIRTAKNMLKMGLDNEIISKATGLSIKEIINL